MRKKNPSQPAVGSCLKRLISEVLNLEAKSGMINVAEGRLRENADWVLWAGFGSQDSSMARKALGKSDLATLNKACKEKPVYCLNRSFLHRTSGLILTSLPPPIYNLASLLGFTLSTPVVL